MNSFSGKELWVNRLVKHQPRLFFWIRAIAAAFLVLVGLFLFFGTGPLAQKVRRASYDWLYKVSMISKPNLSENGTVIVYVDELSQTILEQPRNAPWDRRLYARLIDRLRTDGAAAVVLDVVFSGPSDPKADAALEQAIRENGRVILGVDMASTSQGLSGSSAADFTTLVYPEERFAAAAAELGLVHLKADEDFIVREHYHFTPVDGLTSLSWAAADLIRSGVTKSERLAQERWVKYYGGPETIPHLSFYQALSSEFPKPGYFKNKVVFVGARPTTTLLVERRDEFRSSYSSTWSENFLFMPAVEVHATTFLNLIRRDWLVRFPPMVELLIIFGIGIPCAFGLTRLKPGAATLFFAGAECIVTITGVAAFASGWWTPWLAVVLFQLPIALLASMLCSSLDWLIRKASYEADRRVAALRIHEQAALLDKAQDAIIAHDLEWNVTFWNRGAQKLYGWSSEEILGKKMDTIITKGSVAMLAAHADTMRNGEWNGELHHFTRGGLEIVVQSRWSLVRNEDGAPQGFLVINSDVSEQKNLEQQLLRAQRLDSLGTLAGGIAHDLNNVLAPILMGIELIRMRKPDAKTASTLKTIEDSATRGAALVKQVLTFARGIDGEQKIVHVKHLLKEMDGILTETFPRNINISLDISPDLQPVTADITQLHQVFLNLCVNGRDAMPNGGKLSIRAQTIDALPPNLPLRPEQRGKNFIVIRVADTGTGIPPEIAEKIFEPFFTTKEVGKGTGLGLATVATIIRKHNGFLDYSSTVGQGTEFSVYLPAAEIGAIEAANRTPEPARFGKGETILLVDDEQLVRGTAEEILLSAGYRVITASHAQSALEIVAERGEKLSAVLMDRMMPGMDSLDAMRRMKMLQRDLPIICMSGLPVASGELDKTADAFMAKPFTMDKLLQTMREQIEPGCKILPYPDDLKVA